MSEIRIELDDDLYPQLSAEATLHGCSVEEEAQHILRGELTRRQKLSLAQRVNRRFSAVGGVDLDVAPRAGRPKDNWSGSD